MHLVPTALIAAAFTMPSALAQGFTPLGTPPGIGPIPVTDQNQGSGQCVADFDGDGDLDILIAPATGGTFWLLTNDGSMQFTDSSVSSQLGSHGRAACVESADVDNDGDQDVYVGSYTEPAKLFINDGTGRFTEQAAIRGLTQAECNFGASFGDYDRDGWLDLAIANRGDAIGNPLQNRLYRNTGDGYFVDVTASAGITTARLSHCMAFMDYDEDLWPDLVEINDRGMFAGPNELYRNNGDGTFTAVGAALGADHAVDGMCIDFVDVFNDGGVDFYVTDTAPAHLFQAWNPTTGSYVDATATYGLIGGTTGWASNFFDYDNDGWQDLYVVQMFTPNVLYRNPGTGAGSGPWPDVAPSVGLDTMLLQYTMSIADFDDDGDIDVLHRYDTGWVPLASGSALFRNDVPGGNWLKLDLVGTRSNRDGLGAIVEVDAGNGLVQKQHRRSGISYLSGSDKRLHFGLGAAAQVARVTIRWPSGQVQYLTNVAANQILKVEEPTMLTDGIAPVGGSTTVTASIPGDEGLAYLMPLALGTGTGITLPDGRVFPLDQDSVLDFTVDPFNPIFVGSFGVLNAQGRGTATFYVPPLPWLSGLTVYSAALTLDPPTFPLIRTIVSEAATITVQ